MNEQLIKYLQSQMAPKLEVISKYQVAVKAVEDAKAILANAEQAVANFGDVKKLEADIVELQGFIDSLNAVNAPVTEPIPEIVNIPAAAVEPAPVVEAAPVVEKAEVAAQPSVVKSIII